MLQLKNIRKDYRSSSETVQALKGVDLSFRRREFVSILGPSGCGKTTLLNIIGGLDHYTSGDLIINGRSTKSYKDRDWDVYRNHRIGFIFQSYNLIPHQTVLANVELALTISGVIRKERFARAKRALDRVGLAGKYYKRPNQLSGGQCQRVAIARALVNDPEILLADEPTGALDTATSVQIMNLIKEISGERLVIMVTHNPELAERYSTRIIRLLDGRVEADSHPFSPEEEAAECRAIAEEERRTRRAKNRRRERAKMSPLTAFRLSARNLISKRGRTVMVGIAGSIGIIGIALVLAFSAGIKGYISSMQDDMLSGNPLSIAESDLDFSAISDMMNAEQKKDIIKQPDRVYINSMVEYLARMNKNVNSMLIKNEITEDYVNFVKAMPKEYYAAMLMEYGIDMTFNTYTTFTNAAGEEPRRISVAALTSIYTSLLKKTDFKDYASYVSTLAPSFKQAPADTSYIERQYDVVSGKIATDKDEIMLVLNKEDELSDLLLARLGYYTQEEFLTIMKKVSGEDYDASLYRDSFSYDELLGKTFLWMPNDSVFSVSRVTNPLTGATVNSLSYKYENTGETAGEGVTLRVVGILHPKENVSYGSLTSGIYYTEALTDYILDTNEASAAVAYVRDEANAATLGATYYQIPYMYTYTYEGEVETATGTIGPSLTMADMVGSSGGMMGGGSGVELDQSTLASRLIRCFGGNRVANAISIYPVSFDDKDLATGYLDQWNDSSLTLTVGDKTLTWEDRAEVKYSDTLEVVINLINTMIDVVSYALIAFTSVSLLVSTVMIGIITYVSVVERIKEIGVIRALGGRKRDVSRLFVAETFIIGLLAGVIGIAVTVLISVIVNAILYPLTGIRNLAALPVWQAGVLILLSVLLTLISGVFPARSAARKDPVVALRTE